MELDAAEDLGFFAPGEVEGGGGSSSPMGQVVDPADLGSGKGKGR